MKLGIVFGAMFLVAQSGAMAGDFDEPDSFNAPSGNISCHYTPMGDLPRQTANLHCDRFKPSAVRLYLGEKGEGSIERGIKDACCDNSPVLAYGKTWTGGPFSCRSAETGLRCERADGHGFFVSRDRLDTY